MEKVKIVYYPNIGIDVNNMGILKFGSSREEVRNYFGNSQNEIFASSRLNSQFSTVQDSFRTYKLRIYYHYHTHKFICAIATDSHKVFMDKVELTGRTYSELLELLNSYEKCEFYEENIAFEIKNLGIRAWRDFDDEDNITGFLLGSDKFALNK